MTKARDLSLAAKAPLASPSFTGNVGIGVTPEAWFSSVDALQVASSGALFGRNNEDNRVGIASNAYETASNTWKRIGNSGSAYANLYETDNGAHKFKVAAVGAADSAISWNTAMTIANSGNVLLGGKTGSNFALAGTELRGVVSDFIRDSNPSINLNRLGSNGSTIAFHKSGTNVGNISVTGSSTAYNTSSDYRLKENVTPMSGATAQTKLLKPCNFDWIAGGNVNGFIAHELAEVVPEAVTGTKDAMMDEEYEVTPATDTEAAVMGTRSVPDLQGIDQSKLVPLLTATIQELITRIEALENV